jgi:hypothetical protein
MKIDGGCHCGAIAYEAEIDPEKVVICHCTDCQTLSGTAFRTVALTAPENFKLLTGTLKTYVKTAQSGAQRTQTFCPDCGTPIYSGPVSTAPGSLGIRLGTTRQRAELAPKAQTWAGSALGWVGGLGGVPEVRD